MKHRLDTPNRELSAGYARSELFRVIERLVPPVIDELRAEPYAAFSRLRAVLTDGDYVSYQFLVVLAKKAEERALEVQTALESWARHCKLAAPWVYEHACFTLEMWYRGNDAGKFYSPGTTFEPATTLSQRALFPEQIMAAFEGFYGFEPTADEAAFRKQALDRFLRFVDDHIKAQVEMGESLGYPKRSDKDKLDRHLEMFVLNRWCDVRVPQLESRYHRSRQTTYGVLKEMRELLALPRAARPPGRPRKR